MRQDGFVALKPRNTVASTARTVSLALSGPRVIVTADVGVGGLIQVKVLSDQLPQGGISCQALVGPISVTNEPLAGCDLGAAVGKGEAVLELTLSGQHTALFTVGFAGR